MIKRAVSALLNLLYPNIGCCGCGREAALSQSAYFCPACNAKLCYLHAPSALAEGIFAFSVVEYKPPVSLMIQKLKYDGARYLSPALGSLLLRAYPLPNFPADALSAVPIHPRRQKQRGFNQSDLLAACLSEQTGLPLLQGLSRRINTPPQTGLSAEKRRQNVQNAFLATKEVQGKHILLIDDVLTTGSTIRECARALLLSGAAGVSALCVAKSIPEDHRP
ncbi:MAG: ComF family protein [Christensenellales bacterium]|jgi:ComF family protein